jgi:hypothetical protein
MRGCNEPLLLLLLLFMRREKKPEHLLDKISLGVEVDVGLLLAGISKPNLSFSLSSVTTSSSRNPDQSWSSGLQISPQPHQPSKRIKKNFLKHKYLNLQ